MARIAAVIDGFNFYHSLMERSPGSNKDHSEYRWIDYTKLVKCFITSHDSIARIVYCTAYPIWNEPKKQKHEKFVEVQRKLGVEVRLGLFQKKDRKCRHCYKINATHEEKQTDVNVAVSLFELAYEDVFDTVFLITGDSDICPAVRAVKKAFPQKEVHVIIPINRRAEQLKETAHRTHKVKEHHLRNSLLPANAEAGRGRFVVCPTGWMPQQLDSSPET